VYYLIGCNNMASGGGEGADEANDVIWRPPCSVEDLFPEVTGSLVSALNRPVAGAISNESLPRGSESFQLHSLATPNGQKVGILCEELAAATAGKSSKRRSGGSRRKGRKRRRRPFSYDAHVVRIGRGEQFTSGFVGINPNSKIPAAIDLDPDSSDGTPVRIFESGAIVLYLAEKYDMFVPKDASARAECFSWMMWQMAGQGPMTGNFGHFYVYAPSEKGPARSYGAARYGMEVQRLCSVLDMHLSDGRKFLCGGEYTIADMMCLPWFQQIRDAKGYKHPNTGVNAQMFLGIGPQKYPHACKWADRLMKRPQVQRGMLVCRKYGKPWLHDDRFKHLSPKSKL